MQNLRLAVFVAYMHMHVNTKFDHSTKPSRVSMSIVPCPIMVVYTHTYTYIWTQIDSITPPCHQEWVCLLFHVLWCSHTRIHTHTCAHRLDHSTMSSRVRMSSVFHGRDHNVSLRYVCMYVYLLHGCDYNVSLQYMCMYVHMYVSMSVQKNCAMPVLYHALCLCVCVCALRIYTCMQRPWPHSAA